MKKTTINRIVRFLDAHLKFVLAVVGTFFVFSCLLLITHHKDAGTRYLEAIEALDTGRTQEAFDTLREIETDYPHWGRLADVYYQEGNILYFRKNDIPGALERWQKVLAQDPESGYDFVIRSRMADIYQNVVGDMKQAVENWKYLIEKYPRRAETGQFVLNLIGCYIHGDQYETAIIEIKKYLPEVHDEHIRQQIIIKLGMIYNFQKNYDRAREVLQGVAAHPHCEKCRAMCLMVLADTLEIQEDYQKAIEILGSIPDNVLSIGDKQSRIKNIQKKSAIPPPGPPQ